MKKTFLLAVLAILVLGGGAVLAILYFTGSPASVPGMAEPVLPPPQNYAPAVQGVTGPTGAEHPLPPKLMAPAGVPMVPQDDPRAEKMEAQRMQKIESAMAAQNRRAQERIEKARRLREEGKLPPAPPPQR